MEPWQQYDQHREAYENSGPDLKHNGYVAQRMAKRVNGNVAPDAVKRFEPLTLDPGTSLIVHYENKAEFGGRLFGILHVVENNVHSALNVWEQSVHDDVLLVMGSPDRVVKIETKPSEKWGDSLTKIEKVEA